MRAMSAGSVLAKCPWMVTSARQAGWSPLTVGLGELGKGATQEGSEEMTSERMWTPLRRICGTQKRRSMFIWPMIQTTAPAYEKAVRSARIWLAERFSPSFFRSMRASTVKPAPV
jgi:hypothetical protein